MQAERGSQQTAPTATNESIDIVIICAFSMHGIVHRFGTLQPLHWVVVAKGEGLPSIPRRALGSPSLTPAFSSTEVGAGRDLVFAGRGAADLG